MANREERVKQRDALLASDDARKEKGASRPRMILYTQACATRASFIRIRLCL